MPACNRCTGTGARCFASQEKSVTVKLKGEISCVGGVNEVHMTLDGFGTNALNCDSVAQLTLSGLETNSTTTCCRQCHNRRQELRGRGSCMTTPEYHWKKNTVGVDSDRNRRLGQGGQQTLHPLDGHIIETSNTSLSEDESAARSRAPVLVFQCNCSCPRWTWQASRQTQTQCS